MNKVELEAKVDALQDEINFLRAVYDAVCTFEFLIYPTYSFLFFSHNNYFGLKAEDHSNNIKKTPKSNYFP